MDRGLGAGRNHQSPRPARGARARRDFNPTVEYSEAAGGSAGRCPTRRMFVHGTCMRRTSHGAVPGAVPCWAQLLEIGSEVPARHARHPIVDGRVLGQRWDAGRLRVAEGRLSRLVPVAPLLIPGKARENGSCPDGVLALTQEVSDVEFLTLPGGAPLPRPRSRCAATSHPPCRYADSRQRSPAPIGSAPPSSDAPTIVGPRSIEELAALGSQLSLRLSAYGLVRVPPTPPFGSLRGASALSRVRVSRATSHFRHPACGRIVGLGHAGPCRRRRSSRCQTAASPGAASGSPR